MIRKTTAKGRSSRGEKATVCLLLLLFLFVFGGCRTSERAASGAARATVRADLAPEKARAFDYCFLCANNLKQQGKYDAAFEMYRHCLSIDSTSSALAYELSQFYLFLNQKEKAEQMLLKAVQAEPDNFWYGQTLASVYRQNGRTDKTIALYEDLWKRYPARTELLMELVDLYASQEQYAEAVSALDRLERVEGRAEQISMQRFRIYVTMGNDEQAFTEMKGLIKEYPYDLRYAIMLGDLYLKNDRMQEAYDTYRQVLSEEPDNAAAQLSLASYYEKNEQDSLFNRQLETLLTNPNVGTEMQVNIMKRLISESEQKHQEVLWVEELFRRLLEQPQRDAALSTLYVEYLIYKEADEALISAVLHRILAIEPENRQAQLQLLQYAINREDYDSIITLSKTALQYNPEMMELYYFLGISYYQTKEHDMALQIFKKGVEQRGTNIKATLLSDMFTLIGDLYHERGNDAATYSAYDSALVYSPDNIGTLNNYAYYLSLKGERLDRAEEMSFKTIQAEPDNPIYLDTYAWVLFTKGRYGDAKIYIDSCMEKSEKLSATEYEHAGDIYYQCGQTAKALEFWEKAAKTGSDSKTLQRKIKQKKYIEP